jgi:hypothetical protein
VNGHRGLLIGSALAVAAALAGAWSCNGSNPDNSDAGLGGASCSSNSDCCNGPTCLACTNGVCCNPNAGEACSGGADCCSGNCVNSICVPPACASDGDCGDAGLPCTAGRCGRPNGAACTEPVDCQGGLCNADVCGPGLSGSCSADAGCVVGVCLAGVCCLPAGSPCSGGGCCAPLSCDWFAPSGQGGYSDSAGDGVNPSYFACSP